MLAVRPYDVRHHFTPDVALLEIAAAALGLACPPGSEPLEYEGLTDHYVPNLALSGRTLRYRTRYAIYAVASIAEDCCPISCARQALGSRASGHTPCPPSSSTAGPPTASGCPCHKSRPRSRKSWASH